jgi:hypothetical protein
LPDRLLPWFFDTNQPLTSPPLHSILSTHGIMPCIVHCHSLFFQLIAVSSQTPGLDWTHLDSPGFIYTNVPHSGDHVGL